MRFFSNASWMYGAALSLEGMRRTFLGGTFLSLFIVKEFGLQPHARYTIDLLRRYLEIEAAMIPELPPVLNWLVRPWQDHNAAGQTYLDILEILAEQEFPAKCEFYWPKE